MEKEKEYIVSEKNRERIQNIIDEIQKRCKERLISFDVSISNKGGEKNDIFYHRHVYSFDSLPRRYTFETL